MEIVLYTFIVIVATIACLAFIALVFLLIIKKSQEGYKAVQKLTELLDGTYVAAHPIDDYVGTLPITGKSMLRDYIEGHIDAYAVRSFKGVAEHSDTDWYTVFEARIDHQLPHIFLDSKRGESTSEPLFARSNLVALEGVEFAKYFNVYAERGAELELLQLLEPQVMIRLMEVVPTLNIEFVKDRIYFYIDGYLHDSEQVINLFNAIQVMLPQLIHELSNIHQNKTLHQESLNPVGYARKPIIKGNQKINLLYQILLGIGIVVFVVLRTPSYGQVSIAQILPISIGIFVILRAIYVYVRTGKI